MIADTGAEVWGIDIADKMIRQASSKNSKVTFSDAGAASMPFEASYLHYWQKLTRRSTMN